MLEICPKVFLALKCFALKCFALKCKHRIGLAPGGTLDVGQGQCQEKFFYGRTDGGRRTADKKRRKNFGLGLPVNFCLSKKYSEQMVCSI